jgi:hypothetical protein
MNLIAQPPVPGGQIGHELRSKIQALAGEGCSAGLGGHDRLDAADPTSNE